MKKDNNERLDRIYDKYETYFSTYFGRSSYEDSVRHMERFLNLMVTMAIKSKNNTYKKYIKRYGEVFDQADIKDKDGIDKQSKGATKDSKETSNKRYVDKYKEVFIKNVGEFFKEGVIIGEDGVNDVQVERLNDFFDKVKEHLIDLQDKRDVYEAYLKEIDKVMNENFEGSNIEEWSDLEIYLNLFDIKDELNDILLEMDDLTAEDVDNIMQGMEIDIVRLLEDLEESEDDIDDFEPLVETKETEDPDNEPVTQIISEEEEENNFEDFGGFEGLGDEEVGLDINLGEEETLTELKPREYKKQKPQVVVKQSKTEDKNKEDDETVEITGKKKEEYLDEDIEEELDIDDELEIVSDKDAQDTNDSEDGEEEVDFEEEDFEEEDFEGEDFEGEDFELKSGDGVTTEERSDEGLDAIVGFESEVGEEDYEEGYSDTLDAEDGEETFNGISFEEDEGENEGSVADLDGILGSGEDEEEEEVTKRKGKVVIDDEETSMILDKYM